MIYHGLYVKFVVGKFRAVEVLLTTFLKLWKIHFHYCLRHNIKRTLGPKTIKSFDSFTIENQMIVSKFLSSSWGSGWHFRHVLLLWVASWHDEGLLRVRYCLLVVVRVCLTPLSAGGCLLPAGGGWVSVPSLTTLLESSRQSRWQKEPLNISKMPDGQEESIGGASPN